MDKISIESDRIDVFLLTVPDHPLITLNRQQMEELKKEVDMLLAITINDLDDDVFNNLAT